MHSVNASIITIGDELLIGQTIDTNSAFIAQELNKAGIWVRRRVAVGDVYDEIWRALDEESAYADLIIITGGLGPTADDITKPLLCKYFGGKLVMNEDVLRHVQHLFEIVFRRTGPLLERNRKQAEVPDVCTVLHNARGTAPGMWFEKNGKIFISLPGVPHEMKGLITNEVIPRLPDHFTLPFILHRTAYTSGIGESALAEKIQDYENALPAHIKLAYLPGYGMVKLRLTTSGSDKETLTKELESQFAQLLIEVKDHLVSDRDEGLESVVGRLLKQQNKTIGTAESCTGGGIAYALTSVPGSSAYFMGSVVSYDNRVKQELLGVKKETLDTYGAVSEESVKEMLQGALQQLKTDYAVAVSGIMGPDGGTEEKPVGTVWVAVGNKDKTVTHCFHFRFDRERNTRQTVMSTLDFLRKFIVANA